MKKLHTLMITLFSMYIPMTGLAQDRLNWWGDIPGFMNEQHQHSLAAVEALLERYPPAAEESLERRAALLLLDNVLHEEGAPDREGVQHFFLDRTKNVAAALHEKHLPEGARIWKLYNHGFIVRTASVTIAFDIVSLTHLRKDDFVIPDNVLEDIAEQCDVMFISHFHNDHADPRVAEIFVGKGKPVIVPEVLWRDQPFSEGLVRLATEAPTEQSLTIREGTVPLKVINYPGHQGDRVPNNVPLVITPEGLSFLHTGDQSNRNDFAWIDAVADHHRVDVLLPNCWTTDLPRMMAGVRPAVVIPGHENELGHTVDHREPYWLNDVRVGNEKARTVYMVCGEYFDYVRKVE